MDTTPALPLAHYRLLGNTGLRVSPLCLGTMTFGKEWGFGAEKDESRRIFEEYAQAGGNFVDTAINYNLGTSEEWCGEFLASERERFVLATKYSFSTREGDPNSGGNHRKNMVQSVEASLRRMKTDYIDLYWLHVWEFRTPVEEVMRAVDDLVRAGKILYFGLSDTPAWKVAQAHTLSTLRGWTGITAIQIEYSLIERTVERELMPMARELGLGVTPWSPLGAGVLTGKYLDNPEGEGDGTRAKAAARRFNERNTSIAKTVREVAVEAGCSSAQAALAWLLKQPGVTSPIIGARTVQQLRDNLGCLSVELGEAHLARLSDVSAIEPGFPNHFIYNPNIQTAICAKTVWCISATLAFASDIAGRVSTIKTTKNRVVFRET
ncbi:MAG: aldo/keto reductase [bacterium]|nr:aldo/keto reductase [bacterium]